MTAPVLASVIGNPRSESRTHGVARTLAEEIAGAIGAARGSEIDLATLATRLVDPDDPDVNRALEETLGADVLIIASPTYKATYSGLLKLFLDRIGTGALAGAAAVPVLLGGAPDHRLAVDVHLAPLLLELGANVPARGLFVLESGLSDFPRAAAEWASRHAPLLSASIRVKLHKDD